jgi:hypothetical protein
LQPSVARSVGDNLFGVLVAGPVDLDNEPVLETDEIDDVRLHGNLPLEFGAGASAIAHGAPDESLRLNALGALFTREAPH